MKPWDIVIVYWVDSSGVGRWTDTETIMQDEHISQCWTAGFFLGYSKDCMKIASSASANDHVDHIMFIPKVSIKDVQVIGKGRA